jgi:Right handed beta helix region
MLDFKVKSLYFSIPLVLIAVSTASAQATRTWVSGVGDDVNPCSRTAPCKTWAGAISKTAAGGEIDALDPGGFGALTITKSLTVSGIGTYASTLVANTNGITIAAGATDTVTLRNLGVTGVPGLKGIVFLTGKSLVIEDCVIFGFAPRGISIEPTTNNSQVFIHNTTVNRNLSNGIVINPQGGALVQVVLDHVDVSNNTNFGVSITAGSSVVIRDSTISSNGLSGLRVDATGGSTTVDVESGVITGNNIGIEAITGSTTRISNSNISQNTTGLSFGGGTVLSYGTNRIAGNTFGNGPVSGLVGLQ